MTGSSEVGAVFRLLYLEGLLIALTAAGAPVVKGGAPSPALRDQLQTHRDEIIAKVTEQGIGAHDPGFAIPRRYVVPAGCLARLACPRLGPCSQSLMGQRCDHAESEAA